MPYHYSFRHAPNGMESRGISQEKNCLLNTQPVPPLSLRDMLRETTSPVVGERELDNYLANDNLSSSHFCIEQSFFTIFFISSTALCSRNITRNQTGAKGRDV